MSASKVTDRQIDRRVKKLMKHLDSQGTVPEVTLGRVRHALRGGAVLVVHDTGYGWHTARFVKPGPKANIDDILATKKGN